MTIGTFRSGHGTKYNMCRPSHGIGTHSNVNKRPQLQFEKISFSRKSVENTVVTLSDKVNHDK